MQRPDPLEGVNHKVFAFNEAADKAVLRLVAQTCVDHAPAPLRHALGNHFGNLDDDWSAANAALQGRGHESWQDLLRFGTNSTVGILGLTDVASSLGLERRPADLGQTLGRWEIGPGAYLVWPLLGPSTLRDSAGLPIQLATPGLIAHKAIGAAAIGAAQTLNARAGLMDLNRLMDDAALDKYSFARDAYLAHRQELVCGCDPSADAPTDADATATEASAPPGPAGAAP